MRSVLAAAIGGDMRAAEILLRRVWPERKGRPVALRLPAMTTVADMSVGAAAIMQAVAAGDITPEEGHAVASVLELQRRAVETVELEARIAAVEAAAEKRKRR